MRPNSKPSLVHAYSNSPNSLLIAPSPRSQQYQLEDPDFAPFTSKYDAFLRGKIRLSDAELRGLGVFNDAQKGNCAACHPSARGAAGEPPLFTDFSYDNLGVPRNPAIPANNDPGYFDLGLCGPFRDDLAASRDLCGAFKVPTLRNVALTPPYFHNGRFATLTDAIRFYVRRDTHPQEWYPTGIDGLVQKFDDLPPQYVGNVNVSEAPYNRRPGDVPALDAAEIADLVAFLDTLTDGFQPYRGPRMPRTMKSRRFIPMRVLVIAGAACGLIAAPPSDAVTHRRTGGEAASADRRGHRAAHGACKSEGRPASGPGRAGRITHTRRDGIGSGQTHGAELGPDLVGLRPDRLRAPHRQSVRHNIDRQPIRRRNEQSVRRTHPPRQRSRDREHDQFGRRPRRGRS